MPSLHDKESHQSPWCVTWPGPCHHRAPVVAEKYPPLPLPHPHLLSLIAREGVERWGGSQTDRVQTEAMWVCVIWNRFSANDPHPRTDASAPPQRYTHAHTLCPPSATYSSNPQLSFLHTGQYHPFTSKVGLFQNQCPMASPIQAQLRPSHPLPSPFSSGHPSMASWSEDKIRS